MFCLYGLWKLKSYDWFNWTGGDVFDWLIKCMTTCITSGQLLIHKKTFFDNKELPYLFEYNVHLCIMHTKLFMGVFGTKYCVLYLNKYGSFKVLMKTGSKILLYSKTTQWASNFGSCLHWDSTTNFLSSKGVSFCIWNCPLEMHMWSCM